MATAKNDYITVAPVTPKGKWTVCMRRVGSKDRFAPVAEARTQLAADSIVDALNLMQGEIKRLELPAQRTLEQVRGDLKIAHDKQRAAETERSGTLNRLRETERELDRVKYERNIAQQRNQSLEAELTRTKDRLVEVSNTLRTEQGIEKATA